MRHPSRAPLYYCPPGVPCPAHIRYRTMARQLLEGQGPDQQGGIVYGLTSYDPHTAGLWRRSKVGWYILLAFSRPNDLAHTRLVDGEDIVGAIEEHIWHVPQLLRWNPKSRLASAVPEIYRDYAWRMPADLEPLIEPLRAVMLYGMQGEDCPELSDEAVHDLFNRIMAVNYDVTEHELTLEGWTTREFISRALQAAGGMLELERVLAGVHEESGQ